MSLAPDICPNCDSPLRPSDVFCSQCGQKVALGARFTMRGGLHVLRGRLVGPEHSLLSQWRHMLVRPGLMASDWAAGKRRRYFRPFGMLMVTVAIGSLVFAASRFQAFAPYEGRHADLANFLQRNVNLVQLLQVPLLAAALRLLFPRSLRNFGENLVLAALTTTMRVTIGTLLLVPLSRLLRFGPAEMAVLIRVFLAAWVVYFAWAASQFHAGPRWLSALKGAAAAVLVHAAMVQAIETLGGVSYVLDADR